MIKKRYLILMMLTIFMAVLSSCGGSDDSTKEVDTKSNAILEEKSQENKTESKTQLDQVQTNTASEDNTEEISGSWSYLSDVPAALLGPAMTSVEGKIYLMGGCIVENADLKFFQKVYEYDPTNKAWETKADIPTLRDITAIVEYNGIIYTFGGIASKNGIRTELAVVESFDPVANAWTQKADMPFPSGGNGAAVVDGKIYVFGGAGANGNQKKVQVYDPTTDTWTTNQDAPFVMNKPVLVATEDKIYCLAGVTSDGFTTAINNVQEYNPKADTWTAKASVPHPRTDTAAVYLEDKIYLIGGWTPKGLLASVDIYDVINDTWSIGKAMSYNRHFHDATTVDGNIYVACGTYGLPKAASTFEEFIPSQE